VPGCGIGLRGELLALGTDPNTQEAEDASLVETGGDAVGSVGNDVNERLPDRASAPDSASALAFDASPIPTIDATRWGIDSSSDASVAMDGASDTNVSDALLSDRADQYSDAITDTADGAVPICTQLLGCCNQLMMTGAPPPVLATCFAQPWDAGEGACDMVLAGFTAAGLCP
jgi:hypothetical protein